MLGFGVGAFAMIIVLSTFNGIENLVESLIDNYDPAIQITADGRKTFSFDKELETKISAIEGIHNVAKVLEEKVVIKYDEHQEIAKIKGVSANYDSAKFESVVVLGEFSLGDSTQNLGVFGGGSTQNLGVFGGGLSSKLSLFPGSPELVSVFVPRRDIEYNSLNPMASLSTKYLRASGVFLVKEDVDDEVFITSLDFAQDLLTYPGQISSLELSLNNEAESESIKEELQKALGAHWRVKTRRELNELIYKIFSSEKWFTFAILSLVLVISSFNIFGSLIMLVLDKKKDIGILKSMGSSEAVIRKVFLWQGSYIALIGGGVGILLAIMLVLLQQHFGFISMSNGIVDEYPVALLPRDIILTILTVTVLGYLISIYPARKASKTLISNIN